MLWNQTLASSLAVLSAIFSEKESPLQAAPVHQAPLDCNVEEDVPQYYSIYLTTGHPVQRISTTGKLDA